MRLVAHDGRWAALFVDERARVLASLAAAALPEPHVEHVGSTAVPGIAAKPILDLLVGHPSDVAPAAHVAALVAIGYEHRGEQGVPGRELLVLGGEDARTHHLHLVVRGGALWREALAFRDRLRAAPGLARAYGRLKEELAALHAEDRGAYTAGKAAFIQDVLRLRMGRDP